MAESNEKKELKLGGLPWWLAIAAILICGVTMFLGVQSGSMTGVLASAFAIAVVFNELGERIPIWNTYIGGGLLLVFFAVAILKFYNMIPAKTVDDVNFFISGSKTISSEMKLEMPEDAQTMKVGDTEVTIPAPAEAGDATEIVIPKGTEIEGGANFLEFFIVCLIVGSVLALDRDILLRSFAGYLPAILGGLVCASILGVVTGLIFGVDPASSLIKYVLPVMGGGNGAGAVPLSQIYENVTGQPKAEYYGFAIIILTIANIFAIIGSALLNTAGTIWPKLTGDKKTLLRKGANIARDDKKVKVTTEDLFGAMFIGLACFCVGRLMNKVILPKIAGAEIHAYAYMILFVVLLAALGVIPDNLRAGAKKIQSFMSGYMGIIIMVGMGCDFDIAELFTALTPGNVLMALMIVVGAIIGAGAVGYLVGFYPVDSALTAGLCMANRGGNGDLACLGAADRMDLIAYAQLSSRLGGGIVLVIASFVFSFML